MQTIEMAIRSLLPYGSNGQLSEAFKIALLDNNSGVDDPETYFNFSAKQDFEEHWGKLPLSPLDVFAVSAFITKRTGAYTFVMPGLPATKGRPDTPTQTSDPFGLFGHSGASRKKHQKIAQLWRYGLVFDHPVGPDFVTEAAETDQYLDRVGRAHVMAAINDKALGKAAMAHLNGLWTRLIEMGNQKLVLPIGPWEHLQSLPRRLALFKTILQLMVIADEASAGVSEYQASDQPQPWLTVALNEQRRKVLEKIEEDFPNVSNENPLHQPSETFVFAVDANLAPVLPKSRTVSLGCSLRSLSRHVALGPISTEVKGSWIRQERSEDTGPLNVLLVPFPDEIPFDSFKPAFEEAELCDDTADKNWRWFDVDTDKYLTSRDTDSRAFLQRLNKFQDLIVKASEGTQGGVNGVILPEMALNFDYFLELAKRLITEEDEFLIVGTSDAPLNSLLENHNDQVRHSLCEAPRPKATALKKGNFVATATFFGKGSDRFFSVRVQHKHHRWKLTGAQIIDYGSAGCLDVSKDWWEKIRISNRSLNFWNFRKNSSFVSLICEDLARNDPAQQLIRAVGPSLVFAILMDGPQLPARWPGRFAASLSVDPGSSVLTLTNLGLLKDRGNGGKYPNSREIALWADAENAPRSITMGDKADAVLLTISPLAANTHSLDGRMGANGSHKWILTGVRDIVGPT